MEGKAGFPVLGAFSSGPASGYYIASMPVTSEENRLRGHHFWNLPKITRRIDIVEGEGFCRFESFNDKEALDLSLQVPTAGKAKHLKVNSFLTTKKDGKLLRNPTAFEGDFQVQVQAATLFGAGAAKAAALQLGKGEASDILRRLAVELVPLQTRYATSIDSYFDLPHGAHREV